MTITSTSCFTTATGNGATTSFPFDFPVSSPDDVDVMVNGALQGSGFTVTVDSDGNGGTVSFTTPPVSGAAVLLALNPSFMQAISFENAGAYNPASVDNMGDEGAVRDIYLKGRTDRSIRAPVGETLNDMPDAASRAGQFLAFDSGGNPIAISETITAAAGATVSTRIALGNIAAPANLQSAVLAESGREGTFVFDSSDLSASVAADTAQGIYVAPSSDPTGASGAWVRSGYAHLTPEMFGAAGEGAADDYAAFQAMASLVNYLGGGAIKFGRGKTYLIAQYKTASNGINDVEFRGVNGLTIDLNGSTIKLKGGWDRATSDMRALSGLRFDDSSHVTVRNGEIDGGGATITNSSAAAPGSSYGLAFRSCSYVRLEDLYLHHHTADGLNLYCSSTVAGGAFLATKYVSASNVVCKFNVRSACSPLQCRYAKFENCDFSFTAYNDESGTVCTFANGGGPQDGVDIEADFTTASSPTPIDVANGEMTFDNCRIAGNRASSFLSDAMTAGVYRQDNIHLSHCFIDHPDGVTGSGFIFDSPDSTITNCTINMRDATGYFGWQSTGYANMQMRGCAIYGRANATTGTFNFPTMASGRLLVQGNTFVGTHTAALTSGNIPFRFLNQNAEVRDNKFFVPAAAYASSLADDRQEVVQMVANRAEGNRYSTDLTAAVGAHGTASYYVGYNEATTLARSEKFAGTALGWADTFQPGRKVLQTQYGWDSDFLFGSNVRMAKTTKDWASLAAGSQQSMTVTVTDAAVGDSVDVRMDVSLGGSALRGEVTAANTVTVYQVNNTAAAVDVASGNLFVTVTKRVL